MNPIGSRTRGIALGILLLLAGAAQAARDTTWTLVELPTLGSGGGTARALNNRGDIAGDSAAAATGTAHAVQWRDGVAIDLGQGFSGESFIFAMSDKGTMVGIADLLPRVWKEGTVTTLPFAGTPEDINRGEAIVGNFWTGGAMGSGANRAFHYQDGVFTDLGTLGGTFSSANGLNDKGVVVGFSALRSSSNSHAFAWEDGVMRDLGTLGGPQSFAADVNNHGVIVGNADDANGSFFMVTWDPHGGIRALLESGVPSAINDRGAIVGTQVRAGFSFLYEDGELTVLEQIPAVRDAGWTVFFPAAINDRGWIAGFGFKPDAFQPTPLVLIPK